MAIEVADLVATIRADTAQLTAGLNQANAQIKAFAASVGTEFGTNITSTVNNATNNISKTVTNTVNNITNVTKQAATATITEMSAVEKAALAAGQSITSNFGESTSALSGVAGALGPIGILLLASAAAAVGFGVALYELGAEAKHLMDVFAEYGNALFKLSQQTGVNVDDLAILQYGMELTGVSANKIQRGLGFLEKQLYAAQSGSKSAQASLAALGVQTTDYVGRADAVTNVLAVMSKEFRDHSDGVSKTGLAYKEFGRQAGPEFIAYLNQNAASLRRAADEAREFGLVIGEEGAQKAHAYEQQIIRMEEAFHGLEITIGQEFYPTIMGAIGALTDLISWFKEATSSSESFFSAIIHSIPGVNAMVYALEALARVHVDKSPYTYNEDKKGNASMEITVDGVTRITKAKGDLKEATILAYRLNQTIAEYMALPVASRAIGYGAGDDLQGKIASYKEQLKAITDVKPVATAGGLGDFGGAGGNKAKKEKNEKNEKNDGEEALQKEIQKFQFSMADTEFAKVKSTLEAENEETKNALAERSISYQEFYDKQIKNAESLAQADSDRVDKEIAAANSHMAELEAKQPKDQAESNKILTEKLVILEQLNKLYSESDVIANKLKKTESDLGKQRDTGENAYKQFLKEQQIELAKLAGGTGEFEAQRLAAQKEYDDAIKKWGADSDAANHIYQKGIKDTSDSQLREIDSLSKVKNLKDAIINVDEALAKGEKTIADAAANEVGVRRLISLGLISDKDAQDALNAARQAEIGIIQKAIEAERTLINLKLMAKPDADIDAEIAKIKELTNQLNSLKDADLSPLDRLFKGLINNTKTFQEQFGDAIQQVGQDLNQTLGKAFNSLMHGDVKGFFSGLVTGFQDALAKMASDLATSMFIKLLTSVLGSVLGGIGGGLGAAGPDASGGGWFHAASGGTFGAGSMGIFGENGPEALMALPGGGVRVFSNPVTRGMVGGGTTVHNHVWNITTPDSASFMGKQSQTMIERRLAQATQKGKKNS